jgi:hypothetical protein
MTSRCGETASPSNPLTGPIAPVTSDAGLLTYRELDDALALNCTAATGLHDMRTGQNTQYSLLAMLRQSIYSCLAGYEDINDAERLCLDPALRTVVGGRAKSQAAASTSEMARFETEMLSTTDNLKHLIDLSGKWIDQAHCHRKLAKLILDMDSSVSETYGHQEGAAYNGYFACLCYHPQFLFNQSRRPGAVAAYGRYRRQNDRWGTTENRDTCLLLFLLLYVLLSNSIQRSIL